MVIKSNSATVIVTAPAPSLVLTSITLSPASADIQTGQSVDFTATAYDQNGNPMSGVALTFLDQTTGTTLNMGSTDSSGQVSISVTFNTAGTYTVYAEN